MQSHKEDENEDMHQIKGSENVGQDTLSPEKSSSNTGGSNYESVSSFYH